MTEEIKAKIKASHLKRIQDNPDAANKLREIANDPDMKAARSTKMKALWADPVWRAEQLAKMGTKKVEAPVVVETTQPADVITDSKGIITTIPARKKRIIGAEKKAQYAAARKAKRVLRRTRSI